jgi:hypothetical protein
VKFHWIARENNFVATPAEFGLVGCLPLDLQRLLLNPKYTTFPDVLFLQCKSLQLVFEFRRPLCDCSAPFNRCPSGQVSRWEQPPMSWSLGQSHGPVTSFNFNLAIFAPDGLSHLI